jgi:hypothetical protein
MKYKINRDRIDEYLKAHGAKYTESELMELTRGLILEKPEYAKERLKSFILKSKGYDYNPKVTKKTNFIVHERDYFQSKVGVPVEVNWISQQLPIEKYCRRNYSWENYIFHTLVGAITAITVLSIFIYTWY